jgi:hypothetical protein
MSHCIVCKDASCNNIGTTISTGKLAKAKTQATTATPRAAEMPETVLMPTAHEFSQKFAKNSSERRNYVKKYKEKIALFVR